MSGIRNGTVRSQGKGGKGGRGKGYSRGKNTLEIHIIIKDYVLP